jgi:hypothetical protein
MSGTENSFFGSELKTEKLPSSGRCDLADADKPLLERRQDTRLPEQDEKMGGLLSRLERDFGMPEREDGVVGLTPVNDGKWEKDLGESVWLPDPEYVPKKFNPEGKTWEEILGEHDIRGIPFKDGFPDFSEISKGTVEVPITPDRNKNFTQADIELAKQKGCTPEEVAQWRKDNNHTWHESQDKITMQKVPSVVHNNVPHSGGVSEAKKAAQTNNA